MQQNWLVPFNHKYFLKSSQNQLLIKSMTPVYNTPELWRWWVQAPESFSFHINLRTNLHTGVIGESSIGPQRACAPPPPPSKIRASAPQGGWGSQHDLTVPNSRNSNLPHKMMPTLSISEHDQTQGSTFRLAWSKFLVHSLCPSFQ